MLIQTPMFAAMCIDEEYRSANSPDAIFGQSRNRDGWMATEKCMHRTVGLNSDCHNRFDLCESALRARLADSQDRIACEGGSLDRNIKPRGGTLLLLSGSFQDDPYRMMKHRAYDRKVRNSRFCGEIPFDAKDWTKVKSTRKCAHRARIGGCPWIMSSSRHLLVPNANEPLHFTRTQHFVFGARFSGTGLPARHAIFQQAEPSEQCVKPALSK